VPISLQAALTILLSVLLAVAGQAVVRRRVAHETLVAHTTVAGYVYATIAVIYAVILAQVVVAAWDEYEEARGAAAAEASAVLDLLRLAGGFPEPQRTEVEAALLAYARAVVDGEWPAMARREAPTPETTARLLEVWRIYDRLGSGPVGDSALYAVSLDELDELDDARGDRLLASRRGLPRLMWTTLIAGGVLTVAFAYFFGVENRIAQALMVAMLAATIALLLLLVQSLNAPFRGASRIEPDGFERVLRLPLVEGGAPPPLRGPPAATPETAAS
jgi:Protein of unknown function (DUF4239)